MRIQKTDGMRYSVWTAEREDHGKRAMCGDWPLRWDSEAVPGFVPALRRRGTHAPCKAVTTSNTSVQSGVPARACAGHTRSRVGEQATTLQEQHTTAGLRPHAPGSRVVFMVG
jgi:hypothetical protein